MKTGLKCSSCRFQKLISQQNSIRARTRPAISLLLLLIYFRTSAAPLQQPELSPREEGPRRGGWSHPAFNSAALLFLIRFPVISRIDLAFNHRGLLAVFAEQISGL